MAGHEPVEPLHLQPAELVRGVRVSSEDTVHAGRQGVPAAFASAFPHVPPAARGVVLVSALVVVVAAVVSTTVVTNTQQVIALAFPYGILLVGIALVYRLAAGQRGGTAAVWHQVLQDIGGDWWQLVLSDEAPGLTRLQFYATSDARCAITGEKWKPDGTRLATWRTDVTALQRREPVSIFYYWTGSYAKDPREVSGVGVFEFSAGGDAGTGWFSTGHLDQGELGRLSAVRLRRFDDAERRTLDEGDARDRIALIRTVYAQWSEEFTP